MAIIRLGLHEHPDADNQQLEWFIQEVRYFYPFLPFAVACADLDFEWNIYEFKEGMRTLLDLYGTNHRPDDWVEPKSLCRKDLKTGSRHLITLSRSAHGSYDLVHRCAMAFVTIAIMRTTLDLLIIHLEYEVPEQDFSFEINDISIVPNDKVKINPMRLK